MADRTPSFIVLVPGPWTSVDAVLADLSQANIEATRWTDDPATAGGVRVDVVEEPEGFGGAIARGRTGMLPDAIVDAASQTGYAALIEVARTFDDDPSSTALLGAALRDAGGIAIRMECSGAASTWEVWLDQLTSGDPMELVRAATVLVGGEDTYFTCGMHAFDRPDAQLHHPEPSAAVHWLEVLCAYQVAESPVLASGHTFRSDENAPSRVLERWPDHRHHPDDGHHNPFGLWRAMDPGDDPVSPMNPVPVFIPTLVSILMAAEQQQGKPLSREQVEALTGEGTTMTMDPEDAIAMERSRGYADLEPQRAWAQWQLLSGRD